MKEITLVGMFSNADWCKPGKPETVLAKQIESVLKNKDYSINKILLIYGYQYINGMPAVSNEEIKKNLSYTAEIISDERVASYLKNPTIRTIGNSCDYSSSKNGLYLWIPYTDKHGTETAYFYNEFIKIIEQAENKYYSLNLTSGNVQSREAIQFLPIVFCELGRFFLFTENSTTATHRTDLSGLEWISGNKKEILEEKKLKCYHSRSSFKRENESLYRLFIEKNLQFNIEKKNYFAAYYFLKENENLFNKETIKLFDNCFLPFTSIRYQIDDKNRYYIAEKDLADYFFYRLMYIQGLKGDQKYTKLTMNVLSDLLYTLFHLSTKSEGQCYSDYLIKEQDRFVFIRKEAEENKRFAENIGKYDTKNYGDKTGNGRLSDFEGIKGNQFNGIYGQFRHTDKPKDHYKYSTDEIIKAIDKLIDDLKKLFIRKYKEFTKFSECTKFKDCVKIFQDDLIASIKNDLKPIDEKVPSKSNRIKEFFKRLFKKQKRKEKSCYLSLMGSTDPGNIGKFKDGKEYFMYGSSLCFSKELHNRKNKEFKELRKQTKKNGLPYYFICTKEIASNFNGVDLSLLESKKVYNSKIHLVPFINDGSLDIEQSYTFADIQKTCQNMTDYELDTCFSICTHIIDQLLEKYDHIYIMESSGLPYVKMSFTYLSFIHQDKIKVLECTSPFKAYESELDIKHSEYKIPNSIAADELITAKQHLTSAVQPFNDKYRSTLLDYIKTGSLIPTYLFLYQTQKTTMNQIFSANTDFMNELNQSITEAAKNIPQSEEDFITSTGQDDKLISALIKAKYCLQYKEEVDAVLGLDFCFEYLVGQNLRKYIVNNADTTTSNFYKTLIKKGNIAKTEDCEVKKYVEHALGKLIEDDLKYLFGSITRKSGIYYIAIYYYLKKVDVDTAKMNIKEFDLVWKQCSNLKHNSGPNNGVSLTNETLSNIIGFLDDSQQKLLETWCDHYSFVENAIKEKYKVYLVSEK